MDFRPGPAQQLLVATAREFLRKHADAAAPWRAMAELGWPGLLIPADLGGSDGSVLDVVLLVEELGRAGTPGPFVPSAVVATSMVLHGGTLDQRKRLLPAMAAGERIVTVGLLDSGSSFDPERISLTLDPPGRLTGRKLFVEAADVADAVLVVTRSADDLVVFLLPSDRAGVGRVALDTIGVEKSFTLTLDAVAVGGDDRLAGGRESVVAALAAGALARTAEMVGAAQRVLELAVEHAKTRVQSGRPIGAFQAIQHACADLARGVESARPLVLHAAWKAQEGLPCEVEAAMAVSYAGDACLAVARKAHQVFGAIGYCDEHPLHRLHKQIIAARLAYGDTRHHAETIARAIGLA